ncbi:hypothetical protein GCM10010124_33350 [Pilimelia terevasa]|uniref:Uncharacterized protein n=2 Tax=Pilimelia terevasa TaxID=53372 RepID=A0A8J3BSX3_9ACTN|nr:hypothetical protein GCM10010124_33350 [Pilimelia terevasa]
MSLLTACGDDPAPGPTPTPTAPDPTVSTLSPDDTPAPTESWASRIRKEDNTFWMSIGALPSGITDVTKPSRTSRLTFRLECSRGHLTAQIRFNGAPRIFEHECSDGTLTSDLGVVQKGTELRMSMTGTDGTRYVADMRR